MAYKCSQIIITSFPFSLALFRAFLHNRHGQSKNKKDNVVVAASVPRTWFLVDWGVSKNRRSVVGGVCFCERKKQGCEVQRRVKN